MDRHTQARTGSTVSWLAGFVLLAVAMQPASAQDLAALARNLAAGQKAFMDGRYETAKSVLRPLAEAGEAEAQYLVGVMYAHGRGYEPVCRQAARWFEKAAEQGHPAASFSLGFLLYNGYGLDTDVCLLNASPGRAAQWLKRAAELGMPRAQRIVGRMYATGEGLPVSADLAIYWTGKAAKQGSLAGQYDLALLYAELGDLVESHAWFAVLADKGYPGARINMGRLAKTMTRGAMSRARVRANFLRAVDNDKDR